MLRPLYIPPVVDPEAVTTRDAPSETDPRDVGMSREGVEAIWRAAEGLYGTRMHPAITMCVRRRGRVVLNRAIGFSHGGGPGDPPGAPRVPATPSTPFCIFSASKAVTAALIHLMDERDQLRLDDRVAEYIPEFAQRGKARTTIRHLLTHRAGIPSIVIDRDEAVSLLTDWEEIIDRLCKARPVSVPGRRLAYHAVTGGFILGEIVRRVTGHGIDKLLREVMTEPLGFEAFTYGMPPERIPEVATSYFTGYGVPFPVTVIIKRALGMSMKDAVVASNDPRYLTAVIPSGNIVATASDLSKFFEILRQRGELDGVRVFGERTVRRALVESSYLELDLILTLPIRYGQGFMLGSRYVSPFGPRTPRAFGHYGFVNIIGWADLDREVSAALLTSGKPILGGHLTKIYGILRAVAKSCPRR